MGVEVLVLFALTCVPLVLAPGPSVAYVLTTTLTSGRRAGLAGVAGVEVGYVVHVAAAVFGVSAVVAASAEAFTALKLAGAVYLIWLGVHALRSRDRRRLRDLGSGAPAMRGETAFRRGLVIGALNPKTAVFFLSFLPQFVQSDGWPAWLQMTLLGAIFIAMATVPDGLWAIGGGAIRRRLPALRVRTMDRVTGGVFLGLAAFALSARRPAA